MRKDFIASERKESIYYGDMFRVAGQGCLIFGHGKTKAALAASDHVEENEIARDFVCVTREGDTVFGHFEMEFRHNSVADPIHKRTEIHYMVRMLNEKETAHVYEEVLKGAPLDVLITNYETFIRASEFNITFSASMSQSGMMGMFPPVGKQISPEKALENFVTLTQNSNIKKYLFVPWVESHQEKGRLLKAFIIQDNHLPTAP